jgi:hypothetical protein
MLTFAMTRTEYPRNTKYNFKEKTMRFQPLFVSRHSLLGRRISRHVREFHGHHSRASSIDGIISRRNFLRSAAGAAGLAFWIPGLAEAEGKGKSEAPKPIPGGVSPLGIAIHHFPVQPTATPFDSLTEPSQITDFKGFVGLNRIRGAGRGSGFADPLAFQADMGFMKGQFIGENGKHREGVFGFI